MIGRALIFAMLVLAFAIQGLAGLALAAVLFLVLMSAVGALTRRWDRRR